MPYWDSPPRWFCIVSKLIITPFLSSLALVGYFTTTQKSPGTQTCLLPISVKGATCSSKNCLFLITHIRPSITSYLLLNVSEIPFVLSSPSATCPIQAVTVPSLDCNSYLTAPRLCMQDGCFPRGTILETPALPFTGYKKLDSIFNFCLSQFL